MKKQLGNISLACIFALACLSTPLSAQEVKELHIMNSGGEYGDALDKCVNGPLLKSDNIKVITETHGGYAKIAASWYTHLEPVLQAMQPQGGGQ